MWCKEEYPSTATYRMQQAVNNLKEWTDKWCLTINKEKSSTTLFTLSTKHKAGTINLGDTPLKEDGEATYLGVTFDKRMTWKPHIAQAESKARRKLAILRKLAGTAWGANENILKTVYQGTVRPHLEYGSTAWSNAAKTTLHTLDLVQNQALRIITGAMKSTPIIGMEKLTTIQPLNTRRDKKSLLQAEKFKSLPDHPMKPKVEGLTKNRLKRISFVHQHKRLLRQHEEAIPREATPIPPPNAPPMFEDGCSLLVTRTEVPGITAGEEQIDTVRKALAMAMIDEKYPEEAWIQAYTDGSATDAVKDGGAGVYLRIPSGEEKNFSVATGDRCSNYEAEVEALIHAATKVSEFGDPTDQVVFLTDAKSVLQALENGKLHQLAEALSVLQKGRRVVLQWIPAHCGIPGNEKADRLAKEGAKGVQPIASLPYDGKCRIIKALYQPQPAKDDFHRLTREEQVIVARLRTGHNRLKAHMHRKMKLVPSPICPCGLEDQTTEHILQRCPQFQRQRDQTWPSVTSLEAKLYGSRVDLELTTAFIKECSIKV